MELSILLQEQESIKEKITGALKSLKQWFLDKIDQVKEIFASIKTKISDKVRSIKGDAVASKDVKDSDGSILISKGSKFSSFKGKLNSLLGKVKKDGDSAITDCKTGVEAIANNDAGTAKSKKTSVGACLKNIFLTLAIIKTGFSIFTSTKTIIDTKTAEQKATRLDPKNFVHEEEVDLESLLEEINLI